MSNQAAQAQPVLTFTDAEQKEIAELTNNARIFKNIYQLLQTGLFQGQQVQAVAESLSVAQTLYNQTEAALATIRQQAQSRSATPKAVASGKKSKKSDAALTDVSSDTES